MRLQGDDACTLAQYEYATRNKFNKSHWYDISTPPVVAQQTRLASKLGNPNFRIRSVIVTDVGTGILSSREENNFVSLIHGLGTTVLLLMILPGVLAVRYANAEVTASQPWRCSSQCCAGRLPEVAVADRKAWESRRQFSTSKRPRLSAVHGVTDPALDPIHDARFTCRFTSTAASSSTCNCDTIWQHDNLEPSSDSALEAHGFHVAATSPGQRVNAIVALHERVLPSLSLCFSV